MSVAACTRGSSFDLPPARPDCGSGLAVRVFAVVTDNTIILLFMK